MTTSNDQHATASGPSLAAVIPLRGRPADGALTAPSRDATYRGAPDGSASDGGAAPDATDAGDAARAAHPAGRGRRRPDAGQLAVLLVQLTAEVAAGRRPLRQLEPLLAPSLVRRLAVTLRAGRERPQELPTVRRVFTGEPTPSGAVEATVLIEVDDRVTAIAVRLERHHGAWRATELTAPEAGYAPLPTRSSLRQGRRLDAFDEAEAEAVSRDRDSA